MEISNKIWWFFGTTLAFGMSFFRATDIGFTKEYFSLSFLLKLIVLVTVGVFIVGYVNWKEKVKKENNK